MSKQFKPGDRVRIRTWDSLVEEYGVDERGYIYIPINGESITNLMKPFCGTDATIDRIDNKTRIAKLVNDAMFWSWPIEALTPITAASQGGESEVEGEWSLIGHSHQIADTGDYDGHYEITNGKISILTNDDDEEALEPVVTALNNSGCKFYMNDAAEFENYLLKEELSQLRAELVRTKKDCDHYITLSNTYLKSTSEALDDLAALRAENERLKRAIHWALGYTDFEARLPGEGAYWWRKHLREMS